MKPSITKKDRFLGCFLGGAVGDALGYPVEFLSEPDIQTEFGPEGIRILAQAGKYRSAVISDDTQMTLFVINGLLYGMTNRTDPDGSIRPYNDLNHHNAVWLAHQEWLGTQGDTSRMPDPEHPKMWIYHEPDLHALRAPGGTCLSAIRNCQHGGHLNDAVNNSKGCGAVMKAAPFGLLKTYDPSLHHGTYLIGVYKNAAALGAQTHGHPLGYMSAAALAVMLAAIVHYRPGAYETLQDAILSSFTGSHEASQEILAGLNTAVSLALDPSISDLDAIHQLGEGWVAEEALYIAVFCAVRYQHDFARAIRTAVNHKGDSDSTGSICGNLLGAWLGKDAVAEAFDLRDLEMQDLIEELATDFYQAVEEGIPVGNVQWDAKYRQGKKLSPEELTAELAKRNKNLPIAPLERSHVYVTCGTLDFDHIDADVVVCPTDTRLSGSGGLDRQIHLRAGQALNHACRKVCQAKELSSGDTHVTPGYDLTAQWIVHAVTPVTQIKNGKITNQAQLEFCYTNCLRRLKQAPICPPFSDSAATSTISIAMPLLGTGSLGWPVDVSLECAWNAILTFVSECAGAGPCYANTYQIRLCTTEKHLPLIRPYLRRFCTAFFTFPHQWGYRGDYYLWLKLMKQFDVPRTFSQRESLPRFIEIIRMQLDDMLAPQGLRPGACAHHQELDHGGMSGGGINADFWLLRGLPLLCESFCQRELGSFNEYIYQDYVWPKYHLQDENQVRWCLPEEMHEALIGLRNNSSVFDSLHNVAAKPHAPHQASVPASTHQASVSASTKPAAPTPLRSVGMRYTDRTKQALKVCCDAHQGQTDHGGMPYFLHPIHLAEQMETEDEICTALLHDVVEDTSYTIDDLRQMGISETVLEALRLLTHDPRTPYMDYVLATRSHPLARKVKQADLLHNSDISRLSHPTDHDRRRRRKYRIAQAVLEEDTFDTACNHYRKRIPLDDNGTYYLSVFYRKAPSSDPSKGPDSIMKIPAHIQLIKYSLDMETADDSHYEFDPAGGDRLYTRLNMGRDGLPLSLPELLAQYFEDHSAIQFCNLMKLLHIPYQTFQF